MSVEISAENRQEYQAWTPVEEDLEGLTTSHLKYSILWYSVLYWMS